MFKSLLRTLPSLSGNFTIACKLNEIEKDTHESYHTYVRVADLMPLQNNIYKECTIPYNWTEYYFHQKP